jgi:hypothetical protein
MATDPRALQEILLTLKDAGVAEFVCSEFTVRFPPPAPQPVEVRPVERGKVTGTPEGGQETNYDKLFRGNKPRFGSAEKTEA